MMGHELYKKVFGKLSATELEALALEITSSDTYWEMKNSHKIKNAYRDRIAVYEKIKEENEGNHYPYPLEGDDRMGSNEFWDIKDLLERPEKQAEILMRFVLRLHSRLVRASWARDNHDWKKRYEQGIEDGRFYGDSAGLIRSDWSINLFSTSPYEAGRKVGSCILAEMRGMP